MNNDFAMCLDDYCPAKETCLRHKASGRVAGQNQTYVSITYKPGCENYVSKFGEDYGTHKEEAR